MSITETEEKIIKAYNEAKERLDELRNLNHYREEELRGDIFSTFFNKVQAILQERKNGKKLKS